MAITVYKKGDSHVDNGIKCEIAIIEHTSLTGYLNNGWKMTPEEVGTPDPELVKARPILKKPVASEGIRPDKEIMSFLGKVMGRK